METETTRKYGRGKEKIKKEVYVDFPSILSVYALWMLLVNI